jgi:hypothetical protein
MKIMIGYTIDENWWMDYEGFSSLLVFLRAM